MFIALSLFLGLADLVLLIALGKIIKGTLEILEEITVEALKTAKGSAPVTSIGAECKKSLLAGDGWSLGPNLVDEHGRTAPSPGNKVAVALSPPRSVCIQGVDSGGYTTGVAAKEHVMPRPPEPAFNGERPQIGEAATKSWPPNSEWKGLL